jgi:hypothetical protein
MELVLLYLTFTHQSPVKYSETGWQGYFLEKIVHGRSAVTAGFRQLQA